MKLSLELHENQIESTKEILKMIFGIKITKINIKIDTFVQIASVPICFLLKYSLFTHFFFIIFKDYTPCNVTE